MSPFLPLILFIATTAPAPTVTAPPPVALALVFAPVDRSFTPQVELSREVRQPVAVVGFDQPTVTYYHLRVDDRQSIDTSNGRSRWAGGSRRAVTVRIGVSTR